MSETIQDEKIGTPTGRSADLRYALHLFRQNPLVIAGSIICAVTLFISVFANFLVNPKIGGETDLPLRLCWNNPLLNWHIANINACTGTVYSLGTDSFGRSVLDVIILAIPLDVRIALEVVGSAVLIGVFFGAIAAYAGGAVDEVILRVTDVFLAVPAILLAIVLLVILGRSFEILTFAILITWWPTYVRLIRSQVLGEKEKPYVESLRAMGAGRFRILFRHVVPNSIYPIFVQATLDIGSVILTVSALTFLGFSPSPLIPELGNIANEGIMYLFTAPWLIIFSGLTILVISLGFNLLGDGIRDIFDPRTRR
ncbi:MAG: ABC transporter permease [Thaumarchaeota archaeon]|nr:ABC transporter permease [Nitrososphaerota archaeon]